LSRHRRALPLLAALALPGLLTGCVVLAAAGTGSGIGYVVTEDRTLRENATDIILCTQAIQLWTKFNTQLNDHLNCHAYQGRMLVTGRVPAEDWRDNAIRIAWQVPNVKEVYDEVTIGPDQGIVAGATDLYAAQRLKAALLTTDGVYSNDYIITVENGVLYVLGSARSESERQAVINQARNTPDVKRVVAYIRIRANSSAPDNSGAASPEPPAEPPPAPGDTAPNAPTPRGEIEVTPLQ